MAYGTAVLYVDAETKTVKNQIGSHSKLLFRFRLYLQGDLQGASPWGCLLPNEECE